MTGLEIEELERNLAENDCYKEEKRSADDTCSNLGEEVRDILTALEADSEIDNLEEEEFPFLRDIPKKKLLEETAKVDKVLCKFKTHSFNNNIIIIIIIITTTTTILWASLHFFDCRKKNGAKYLKHYFKIWCTCWQKVPNPLLYEASFFLCCLVSLAEWVIAPHLMCYFT